MIKNRWVLLFRIVKWDVFAREYYRNFTWKEGRTSIDARVAPEAVIIKHFNVERNRGSIRDMRERLYDVLSEANLIPSEYTKRTDASLRSDR